MRLGLSLVTHKAGELGQRGLTFLPETKFKLWWYLLKKLLYSNIASILFTILPKCSWPYLENANPLRSMFNFCVTGWWRKTVCKTKGSEKNTLSTREGAWQRSVLNYSTKDQRGKLPLEWQALLQGEEKPNILFLRRHRRAHILACRIPQDCYNWASCREDLLILCMLCH